LVKPVKKYFYGAVFKIGEQAVNEIFKVNGYKFWQKMVQMSI